MTFSVPTLDPPGWKSLRARHAFLSAAPEDRPRRPRSRFMRQLALVAMGMAALGVGFVSLPDGGSDAPQPQPANPPPIAAWTTVTHPFVAYDLAGGPYAKLPLHYAARRNHLRGAREDTLTYGVARPGESFLKVAFLRRGADEAANTSMFLDAARLAAGGGLAVTRSGLGARLDTRFGPFEVAGVAVESAGASADCLAFRLAEPAAAPVLGITGLACGTVEHPLDPATLACTIDRLDLVSAGDDEALRAIFVAAERRRRDVCSARTPVRLGAADDMSRNDVLRGTY